MFHINLNGKKYKCPSQVNEINIDKGILIQELVDAGIDFNSKVEIIGLITTIPISILMKFKEEKIEEIYRKLSFVEIMGTGYFYPTFKLAGVEYGLLNLDDMTTRDYLELEYLLNQGRTTYEFLPEILSILYRPIVNKTKNLINILFNIGSLITKKNIKPLKYNTYTIADISNSKEQASIFRDKLDFGQGLIALNYIIGFNLKLSEEYKSLFETIEGEEEEEGILSIAEIWGSYNILNNIAPTLMERDLWLSKNIREYFKYLGYLKQVNVYKKSNI